jgi:hypothetical protein
MICLGTILAERQRIPLHHAKGKRKPGVRLPNVGGRQEFETTRETRGNAKRERAVKLRQNGTVMLSGAKHLWISACEDQCKN